LFFAGHASAEVLFSENFDGLVLQEPVSNSENFDFGEVWTDVPPTGWVRDNDDTPEPDPDDPDIGPDEFYGFTFVDAAWWVATADDQQRSLFTSADGIIMVADPDEYDDQGKLDGRDLDEGGGVGFPDAMNVFITTPAVSLSGFDRKTAQLTFDSSFRPYDFMTGLVDVSYDNGNSWKNLLTLDLDAFGGVNSSLDRVDEPVELDLEAPDSAASVMVRFGLVDAGNDWWWAIDNVEISATAGGVSGDFDGSGALDAADIDDLTRQSASKTNPAGYDLSGDALVDEADVRAWVKDLFGSWIGDANLDRQFNSSDLVTVLASGTYEADVEAVWTTGDFNGDGRTNSTDLVAALADGGYELGAPVAAVPEPSSIVLGSFGLIALLACWRRGS
jgi:hypothetical protein